MPDYKIKNARIESTMLGTEDHGIMTAWLMLDYNGVGQGFGGYGFDNPIKNEYGGFRKREGIAWGMEYIIRVLKVVGVTKWEDLPGKFIRVKCTHTGILEIGNILKDEWFNPSNDLNHLVPTKGNKEDTNDE